MIEKKPTEMQIGLIFKWMHWLMPRNEAVEATDWLENNASRWDVSKEIKRLDEIKQRRHLTKEDCFASPIWNEYKLKRKE